MFAISTTKAVHVLSTHSWNGFCLLPLKILSDTEANEMQSMMGYSQLGHDKMRQEKKGGGEEAGGGDIKPTVAQ